MKQIALWLAIIAASLPGAAFAQHAYGGLRASAPVVRHPAVVGRHSPGFHRHRRRGDPANFDAGWPVFMVPPGAPGGDIVTHEFIDPRAFRPRAPRVDVLSDEPVVFRQPPHIIEIGRHKHRRPILVVRRGVISRE